MSLLYLSIATMFGVALGRLAWDAGLLDCHTPAWLWLAPLIALPATPLINRWTTSHQTLRWPASAGFRPPINGINWSIVIACVLALLAGSLRFASHPFSPCWTDEDLAYYNLPASSAFDASAPKRMVTGYISSYPLISDVKQRIEIEADAVEQGDEMRSVSGALTLNTSTRQRYSYGQPVQLEGRLATPPDFEDFSYSDYLARSGVYSVMYGAYVQALDGPMQGSTLLRWLYTLRASGEELINRSLPEPYAALANGMLLGIESGIPDDLYDKFSATGSTHVIVISGSNVALIAGILIAFGQRFFGRKHALWPALIGIVLYALLVGGDAAVLRASAMGILVVIAASLGRRSTAIVSLAAACWVMVLANPLALWDVGFQLSSAATAGLVLFTPPLTAWASRLIPYWRGGLLTAGLDGVKGVWAALSGFVQDGLIVTIAASLATLPLILHYFGRLSLVSLLTNIMIVPVQPLIMLAGTAALPLGLIGLAPLSQVLFWIAGVGLVWTVAVVEGTAALPGASIEIAGYSWGAVAMTYTLIFALMWRVPLQRSWQRLARWLQVNWQQRLLRPATAGALCVATVLIWSANRGLPDGRLHVHFLDIGQGDGIFIETPSGRQVLIDGGASPQALFGELGEVMPFWDRSIDLLVMTHPDTDHMLAQVDLPRRFSVATALETAVSNVNRDADAWRASVIGAGAQVQLQHNGGWIDLGDGAALWVLWPLATPYSGESADNENSLVLKLVYGDFSVLLTGDAGLPAEEGMLRQSIPLAATVLKAGHHGSNSSTGASFLVQVNPLLTVIQVGADNDYGHPHDEVLERLAGRNVLRNDLHGRVHVMSDGRQMWVETERGSQPLE
jgi:competence protein ComEC